MQQNRIGADNPRQQEEIENLQQQLYDYEVEYTNLQNAYGDLRQRFIDLEAAHNILKQTSEATKTDFRRLQKEYDMMRDEIERAARERREALINRASKSFQKYEKVKKRQSFQ